MHKALPEGACCSSRSFGSKQHSWYGAGFFRFEKQQSRIKINTEVGSNVELKMAKTNPYGTVRKAAFDPSAGGHLAASQGCYATRDFKAGEVVTTIRGHIDNKPDFESLQIKEGALVRLLVVSSACPRHSAVSECMR
jgi:hypothetical protein